MSDDLIINNEETTDESTSKDERFDLKHLFVIILLIIVNVGNSFTYDNPSALQDVMIDVLPHVTFSTISSFYSWYSWPNVILCVINGYIIDKILGYRIATILFTSLVTFGQLMFVFGTFIRTVWLMQVARLIYGIGAEPLQMCAFKYATKWFKHKNSLSMAITAVYCTPTLGSVLNMAIMLPIFKFINSKLTIESYKCLALTLLVSAFVATISIICAIILAIMDKKEKHVDKEYVQNFQIKNLLKFPLGFWIICLICFLYYATLYPYIGSVKSLYMFKYGLTGVDANFCNSLVYIVASVSSPIIGKFVDKIGYHLYALLAAVASFTTIHALIAFTYLSPYICSASIGFVNTFTAASLWPLVSLVIATDRIATAYGMMQSIQNLGLALANLLVGHTLDYYGYFVMELINIFILLVTIVCVQILFFINNAKGLNLNSSKIQRSENLHEN